MHSAHHCRKFAIKKATPSACSSAFRASALAFIKRRTKYALLPTLRPEATRRSNAAVVSRTWFRAPDLPRLAFADPTPARGHATQHGVLRTLRTKRSVKLRRSNRASLECLGDKGPLRGRCSKLASARTGTGTTGPPARRPASSPTMTRTVMIGFLRADKLQVVAAQRVTALCHKRPADRLGRSAASAVRRTQLQVPHRGIEHSARGHVVYCQTELPTTGGVLRTQLAGPPLLLTFQYQTYPGGHSLE